MDTCKIVALAQKRGVIRAADLKEIGASRTLLPYLEGKCVLRRIARGAYLLADRITENETFMEAIASVPQGVICLLSALQFHEITTQMPMETWVAIVRGKGRPRSGKRLNLRIVQFGEKIFTEGIEIHNTAGCLLRVYSPAKTVVDCFKFRNRIGLDVAREALRDALAQKKTTRDEIWRMAKCCRMSRVMRPYLEMVS